MLTFVCGTRPEFIKARPLILEAKKRKLAFRVVHTGQHTDLMLGTGVRPDYSLPVAMSGNDPEAFVASAQQSLYQWLSPKKFGPVLNVGTVVVIGDTASALAGARFGYDEGLPVAHVEAGLRSHDLHDPWPEEGYRVEIDRLATYHFCPTAGNIENLTAEIPNKGFYQTGNTITDALRLMKVERQEPRGYVLVTLHRRESFGEPMRQILTGLRDFALQHPETPILWPMHPNPKVSEALGDVPMPGNVLLRGPVSHRDFLTLLSMASCVLTDSGGVVEEATTLGVPLVCARNKTERPEAFAGENGVLLPPERCPTELAEQLLQATRDRADPSTVFGNGHAAERILEVLS